MLWIFSILRILINSIKVQNHIPNRLSFQINSLTKTKYIKIWIYFLFIAKITNKFTHISYSTERSPLSIHTRFLIYKGIIMISWVAIALLCPYADLLPSRRFSWAAFPWGLYTNTCFSRRGIWLIFCIKGF